MLSRLLPIVAGLGGFVAIGASLHHRSSATVTVAAEERANDVARRSAELRSPVDVGREEPSARTITVPAQAIALPGVADESLPGEGTPADDESAGEETSPEAYTARSYYHLRFENVKTAPVGLMRPALSEALCARHPEACAVFASAGDETLVSELLDPPTEEQLARLETEAAAEIFGRMEALSDAFDEVDRYWQEVWGTSGPGNVEDVETWLGTEHRARMSELVADPDGWMQAVRAFGTTTVEDYDAGLRTEHEAAMLEILWEERCRLEEQLVGLAPDLAIWFHLSRSATTHIWDGTYWIPPDEEVQFLFPFPVHLDS